MPYLVFTLENRILNGFRAGQVHSKDCLTVNLDIYCFNLPVASSNKKKKKNMENWRHFRNHRKLLK